MEVGYNMRYAVDPRQKPLFDPAESLFSPMAVKYMREDWPGLFRTQILHLMPVAKIAEHFHPTSGCPTKELYSMAGVIFLKEFFNLTIAETARRYVMDTGWQYALNVIPTEASLSHATVERYMKLFAEDDIAAEIFHRVTSALIEALELDVSRQRLDSTHVFSDMATFGRTRLMGVAVKRFLTQLKRHHRALYDALPEAFGGRYAPSQAKLFADFTGAQSQLRQTVAKDLVFLVNRFCDDEAVTNRTSYQAMHRVLQEQCTVFPQCPVQAVGGQYVLRHTPSQRRLAARRAEQATEAFAANYRIRGGGESVNSGLKRKTGMGRVRTRGQPRVEMAVILRCAGWNLFRALAAFKKRGIRDFAAFAAAFCRILSDGGRRQTSARPLDSRLRRLLGRFSPLPTPAVA
jgi:hypothetical protein